MLRQTAVQVQRKMVKKDDHIMSIVPLVSGVDCQPDMVRLVVATVSLSIVEAIAEWHEVQGESGTDG
jgi:hypothetical protein